VGGYDRAQAGKFIFENRARLTVKFAAAVGAVFDFYTGNIKARQKFMVCNHGLEWLPKAYSGTPKLWQRMFVSAPVLYGM